jgi:putative endonuclease
MGSEFALKYGCKILVYYFFFDAITAEKKLKQGSRQRKIRIIESVNSEWKDLYAHFFHSS